MLVYKLVTVRNGCRMSFNLNMSIKEPNGLDVLPYAEGETTLPVFGKLFAYDSYKYAKEWIYDIEPLKEDFFEIWEAEADKVEPSDYFTGSGPLENLKQFWVNQITSLFRTPKGTVYCSSIKLIKKLYVKGAKGYEESL